MNVLIAGDSETVVLVDTSNVIVEPVVFSTLGLPIPSLLRRLEDLSAESKQLSLASV